MKIAVVLFAVFGFCSSKFAAIVDKGKDCARANVTDVRIQNCEFEPCTIKKGEQLPVEVDFIFETPTEAEEVNFNVFISYWAVPPIFYGSSLASESNCEKLNLSTCPPKAGVRYTLQSSLYVDPESKDTLNGNTTGIKRTQWTVNPTRRENSEQSYSYSTCPFFVDLNIVE